MGNCTSDTTSSNDNNIKNTAFKAIGDNFKCIEEVQQALRKAGLESSNLIVGIDFTKSNTWTGEKSFNKQCLHTLLPPSYSSTPGQELAHLNPYEAAITVIGQTLEVFDDDKLISVYGFGDSVTRDQAIFAMGEGPLSHCKSFINVLQSYRNVVPNITLSGGTNFGPLIRQAVEVVKATKAYHILLIIADGQVSNLNDTIGAIVYASNYPLSIVMIGVGDGPWDAMRDFDDGIPQRKFDNVLFFGIFFILILVSIC